MSDELPIRRCEFCREPLPPYTGKGRPPRYCSNKGRCRKAAERQRRLEESLPWKPGRPASSADEPVEAFLVEGRSSSPDEQTIAAVLETRALRNTFRKLSDVVRPELAPRCEGMAADITDALGRHFPKAIEDD